MKIIFIIYNIFEVKSGVSNKYINFINYLIKNNIDYLLLTTFEITPNETKYNIIKLKGIHVPFYPKIKIPIIEHKDLNEYVNNNDIIIFHSEFYWLYSLLYKIKLKKNVKLIPTWHTNYDYYCNLYFKNNSILLKIKNILFQNLKNNFFSGLITTGEISKKIFLQYTSNVFNANEICFENFNQFTINTYDMKKEINIIYTGRIAIEKNLLLIIDILRELDKSEYKNYKMHFIGNGPYLDELVNYIKKNGLNRKKIIFYGEINDCDIIHIYKKLENRIFIQPSKSETFGKSCMEACFCGIPLFIIKCDIHEILYNENNAFIFNDVNDFMKEIMLFFKLKNKYIEKVINNAFQNACNYDQKVIFEKLKNFILNLQNYEKYDYYNEYIINYLFQSIHESIKYIQK